MKGLVYSSRGLFGEYVLGSVDASGRTRPFSPVTLSGYPVEFDQLNDNYGRGSGGLSHDCLMIGFAEGWEDVHSVWGEISAEVDELVFAGVDASEFLSASVLHPTACGCHIHNGYGRTHLKTGRPIGLFNFSNGDRTLLRDFSSLMSLKHGLQDPHDDALTVLADPMPKYQSNKRTKLHAQVDEIVCGWFEFGHVEDRVGLVAALAEIGVEVLRDSSTAITISYEHETLTLRGKKYNSDFRYSSAEVGLRSTLGTPGEDDYKRTRIAELENSVGRRVAERGERNERLFGGRPAASRPLSKGEWREYHNGLQPSPLSRIEPFDPAGIRLEAIGEAEAIGTGVGANREPDGAISAGSSRPVDERIHPGHERLLHGGSLGKQKTPEMVALPLGCERGQHCDDAADSSLDRSKVGNRPVPEWRVTGVYVHETLGESWTEKIYEENSTKLSQVTSDAIGFISSAAEVVAGGSGQFESASRSQSELVERFAFVAAEQSMAIGSLDQDGPPVDPGRVRPAQEADVFSVADFQTGVATNADVADGIRDHEGQITEGVGRAEEFEKISRLLAADQRTETQLDAPADEGMDMDFI